ncbi:unnamed protein product, partial [Closterium sp. NIES-54]
MRNTLFPTPSFLSLRFTPPASILVLRHPVRTFPSSLSLPAPPLPAPPLAPSGHGTGGGAVHAQQPLCRGAHFPFLAFAPCFTSLAQGMAQVEELYTRNSHVVERLKEITKGQSLTAAAAAAAAAATSCYVAATPAVPAITLPPAPSPPCLQPPCRRGCEPYQWCGRTCPRCAWWGRPTWASRRSCVPSPLASL